MIEAIELVGEGAYDKEGTRLTDLKPLNFIFGPNGSGKTTISRVIEDSDPYPNCSITWTAGVPLETRVYNRDFVKRYFETPGSIKGIYTLGDGNIEAATMVAGLKRDEEQISEKLRGLKKNLNGEDGEGGKSKERNTLEAQLTEDVWRAKRNLGDLGSAAFSGLNASKAKFAQQYRSQAERNKLNLRELGALKDDARTIFSSGLTQAEVLAIPDSTGLVALESSDILAKKVVGKTDVDIAALIDKLGISDWVQEGRQYFDQLDDQCPFCQQSTEPSLRQRLEDYFDENYAKDVAAIKSLSKEYAAESSTILDAYNVTSVTGSKFLDIEVFNKDLDALRMALVANRALIDKKKKEPSAPVSLKDTATLSEALNGHIQTANAKVKENNETLRNLNDRTRGP
jgi:wobble nucleotide-excising tRNase